MQKFAFAWFLGLKKKCKLKNERFIMQQSNSPKHESKSTENEFCHGPRPDMKKACRTKHLVEFQQKCPQEIGDNFSN